MQIVVPPNELAWKKCLATTNMDEGPNDLYLKTFIHVWLQTLKDYDSQLFSVITAPLIELARDESVQSKVLDVARQFFSNSNITINLIPALIAGGLLLLLHHLLLFPLYLNRFWCMERLLAKARTEITQLHIVSKSSHGTLFTCIVSKSTLVPHVR